MRAVIIFLSTITALNTALAHPLDGDATLTQQVTHQIIGAHHWPLIVLVIAFALVLVARLRGGRSSN